jgi:hypothetical protein
MPSTPHQHFDPGNRADLCEGSIRLTSAPTCSAAHHALAERPNCGVVGQVVGIHRYAVVAVHVAAIDQQVATAVAADVAEGDRSGCVAGGSHSQRVAAAARQSRGVANQRRQHSR